MKKTYIKPNTEMIQVELQQMIAESLQMNSGTTLGDDDKGSFLGRGGSDWDDED